MQRVHLLSNRKMFQDGTYVIKQFSEEEFLKYLGYHIKNDTFFNHITNTSMRKLQLPFVDFPRYVRLGKLEHNDRLLIAEKGKYYRGTYLSHCY